MMVNFSRFCLLCFQTFGHKANKNGTKEQSNNKNAEKPGSPSGHGLPCRARFRDRRSTLPGRLRRFRGGGRVAFVSKPIPASAADAAVAVVPVAVLEVGSKSFAAVAASRSPQAGVGSKSATSGSKPPAVPASSMSVVEPAAAITGKVTPGAGSTATPTQRGDLQKCDGVEV